MAKEIRRRLVSQTLEGVAPLLSRLFVARGITSAAEMDLSLKHLLPPTDLKGIVAAAELAGQIIRAGKKILILGDFDADGATSCVLMVHGLRALGATQVDYLVPNRFEFGYGLTPEIVDVAKLREPHLIITVDNGISSHEGVDHARSLGIQTLITDHHLAPETLPAADVILNPNQPGCDFKSKNLAGVGVAFYLLSAIRQNLADANWFQDRKMPVLADYLDLVALGTIADVVPMDRNNRILVNEGLRRIRAGKCRSGIKALLHLSGHRFETVTSQDLAFFVAPRLNAAGRLEDISLGIECLLSEDESTATELAAQLDRLNAERREIEHEMKQQALQSLVDTHVEESCQVGITLYDDAWHQGVVGIVAARIKDRLHRPVVAFAKVSDTELKGSARSIQGLHIRDAFAAIAAKHPGLLVKFGGHAMAAGLTLNAPDLARFQAAFDEEARRWLSDDDLTATVITDGELQEPLTVELGRGLGLACPWGQGFPEPVFDGEFEIISQRIVGGRHLKMKVRPVEREELIDAIAFGYDTTVEGRFRRIAYRIGINEYRGQETAQIVVDCLDVSGITN
ncbi:MAG: single-stranded-DNA-specific exonuclease [Candidatus Azotimanducaceae bacterium]|jgi:single-stranded-DNA-specific exonuclease